MGDTTSEDAAADDATDAGASVTSVTSVRSAILEWARLRALPFDRPLQATVFTWAAVIVGAAGIKGAYEYHHFTHQWQNTAVIWVAAACALAAAHRALAVAILRPRRGSIGTASCSVVVLVIMGSAAIWQTDQSMTVPSYTEADPATYGDSVYLYLEGDSEGAVSRVELHSVVELEFGHSAQERTRRDPLGRCWEIRTTVNTIAAAQTWPWETELRSPSRVQSLAKVEVKEVHGDWIEESDFIAQYGICETGGEQLTGIYDEVELGAQGQGRIVVPTTLSPPIGLRLTDSKGRVNVISLQDPGTQCASFEHLWEFEQPDDEEPCERIFDLQDQGTLNEGEEASDG